RKGSGAIRFQLTNRFNRSRSAGPFQRFVSKYGKRAGDTRANMNGNANNIQTRSRILCAWFSAGAVLLPSTANRI
ncbi:hypothetical protein, partial [Bradyrhizobium diazoefficiens]|uniref:hypothetical protein n=1 Tax=Bradyrhizobium diazoefficiens TaxID=1355477 RepID=UPI001B8B107E